MWIWEMRKVLTRCRIPSHYKKDEDGFELQASSAKCQPAKICILVFSYWIFKWNTVKIHFNYACVKTRNNFRDAYVISTCKFWDQKFYCPLLPVKYCPFTANLMCQTHCDDLLLDLGFKKVLNVLHVLLLAAQCSCNWSCSRHCQWCPIWACHCRFEPKGWINPC